MLKLRFVVVAALALVSSLVIANQAAEFMQTTQAGEVAITVDDFYVNDGPKLSGAQKNQRILAALAKHKAKAALFVTTQRLELPGAKDMLRAWGAAGHIVANHTHSHENYHKTTFELFSADIKKADKILRGYAGFQKLFRFPYLKEGDTAYKRDQMRRFLTEQKYLNGAVTIDASDWYVSDRLAQKLKENPKLDLKPYGEYYLEHVWRATQYYDQLARDLLGRSMKHTLLIHHNLLNALFLDDLLAMYKAKGWKIVSAKDAFKDPIFGAQPIIAPAGESLLWGIAKETGRFEARLRYPGEDSAYEEAEMNRRGL